MTSRLVALAAVVGAISMLAGCTQPPQWDPDVPTVVETPDVVWESGPPSGQFEDDEAVIAARAAALGIVLARNNFDYTVAQLTDFVDPEHIEWMYENDLSELHPSSPALYPGPIPLGVIEVTSSGDSTEVVFCAPNAPKMTEKHPDFVVELNNSYVLTFTMRPAEDGSLRLADLHVLGTECDTSTVAIGRFSPTPELPDSVPRESVRPPLGYVEN